MKRTIAAFALFAATTIALATHASAQERPFQATLPFNFTVGNRELPTGNYLVRTFGNRQVQIQNVHQNISAYALAYAGNRLKDENEKLVFDEVGGQYFLREIVWTSEALEIPTSPSEKRAYTLVKQSIDTDARTFTAGQK